MTEPFLGQVTLTAFDYAPKGYALCDGATLPIAQNQALFSLLGTTYGGDGQTTFALPDLRGRVPIHRSTQHPQGEADGAATVTLSEAEMPTHTHTFAASSEDADSQTAAGAVPAESSSPLYRDPQSPVEMASVTVSSAGGSEAHENMQPYTVIGYCIAVQGVFPTRN